MRQFEQTSNPVMVFCEDYSFGGTISRDEIYQWYQEWCTRTGHKQLSRERFLPKFRECMDKRIKGERRVRIKGQLCRVMDFDLEQEPGTEED